MPKDASLGAITFYLCLFNLLAAEPKTLPALPDVLASKQDLWGEAAMAQPNGASYEFFENLLPPPRYVNSDFHFYPIVLSAPNALVKARLISNGSGLNLPGGARSWHDVGTPFTFRVGTDEFRFGEILERLEHPTLAEGYLAIPKIRYAHATEVYELEAFAATDPALAEYGTVFVKFALAEGTNGLLTLEPDAPSPLSFKAGVLLDRAGQVLALFDDGWTWERQRAHAKLRPSHLATAALFTKPLPAEGMNRWRLSSSAAQPRGASEPTTLLSYTEQREKCAQAWRDILASGMQVQTPEPLVNNAWRNLIIQQFSLTFSNRLCYSAGNQYEKMYAAETSDAAVPLMTWGYERDMKKFLPVILGLVDKRLPHHFAAHKLEALSRFYQQTRDLDFIRELRPRWQKELDLLLTDRSPENGLLNKENYCTDIEIPVYSFPANAIGWAALRDMAPLLEALGEPAEAAKVRQNAAELKKHLLAAVEKNTRRETTPPFIPMAFFYGEDIHDPITETRLGSYWDLVANYIIGSGLFIGSERELWLPRYFEQHGGLFMGLTRSAATNHTFWTGKERTNPLYGMRYIVDTLRRDEVERALVSFYGMLAHGMTRNTFIGAEGCSVEPLDAGGRYFYCPPNSASNGQWLAVLRHLLIQDWDLDNDGEPDTLRLAFATPRRWLEDGHEIIVERAPTAFGPVSFHLISQLAKGKVITSLDLPSRNPPRKILLRARLPDGWKVSAAALNGKNVPVDENGTVEISGLKGKIELELKVGSAH